MIALDLLDQCMQSNGIQLQMHVMKKVVSVAATAGGLELKANPKP